jgi:hypothetical protein
MSKFDVSSEDVLDTTTLSPSFCSDTSPQEPSSNYGYSPILNKYRNDIDNIKTEDWKKARWYINDYDFFVKDPIINRAFYKYWEMVNEFEIFENYSDDALVLHGAEAPGGFIQGTNIYLQVDRIVEPESQVDEDGFVLVSNKRKKHIQPKVYTISLNKDLPQYRSYNLPSYNKNVINKHVCITYGKDNTGDINNLENVLYLKKMAPRPFYLITADGGFDEGTDFNNKEQLHHRLILSEIFSAIALQQKGGHFILKMFDVFTHTSVQLLYLLSLCYEEVNIYKPKTSRPTNSEKYVVCKGFKLQPEQVEDVSKQIQDLSKTMDSNKSKYISINLFDDIPDAFVAKVKVMNETLLQQQCEWLDRALELCHSQDFLQNYETRLEECLNTRKSVFAHWQETYNLTSFV